MHIAGDLWIADPTVHRGVAWRKAPNLAVICWALVNVNDRAHRPAVSGVDRQPKATYRLRVTHPTPPPFPSATIYCVVTATLVPPRTTPPEDKRRKIRLAEGSKAIAPVAWANTA